MRSSRLNGISRGSSCAMRPMSSNCPRASTLRLARQLARDQRDGALFGADRRALERALDLADDEHGLLVIEAGIAAQRGDRRGAPRLRLRRDGDRRRRRSRSAVGSARNRIRIPMRSIEVAWTSPFASLPQPSGLWLLHRFLSYAEDRGWIYYRKKRGSYGGLGVTSNVPQHVRPVTQTPAGSRARAGMEAR